MVVEEQTGKTAAAVVEIEDEPITQVVVEAAPFISDEQTIRVENSQSMISAQNDMFDQQAVAANDALESKDGGIHEV
jgi:hypothetical protein